MVVEENLLNWVYKKKQRVLSLNKLSFDKLIYLNGKTPKMLRVSEFKAFSLQTPGVVRIPGMLSGTELSFLTILCLVYY